MQLVIEQMGSRIAGDFLDARARTLPLIVFQSLLPIPVVAWGLARFSLIRTRRPWLAPARFLTPVIAFGLMGVLVGLLYENAPFYVFGDLYQLILLPSIFITFTSTSDHKQAARAGQLIIRLLSLLSAGWLAIELYYLQIIKLPVPFSSTTFVAPLLFVLLKKKTSPLAAIWAGVLCIGIVLSFKRTSYLALAMTLILIAIVGAPRIKLRIISYGLMTLLLALLLSSTQRIDPMGLLKDRLLERGGTFGQIPVPGSVEFRLEEARLALEKLVAGDSVLPAWLTGFGLGAAVDTPYGKAHTIHFTWVAFLYRTGILGAIWALAWFAGLLLWIWKRRPRKETPESGLYLALTSFLIFHFLSSMMGTYIFWKDFELAAFASTLAVLASRARWEDGVYQGNQRLLELSRDVRHFRDGAK